MVGFQDPAEDGTGRVEGDGVMRGKGRETGDGGREMGDGSWLMGDGSWLLGHSSWVMALG